MSSYVVAPLICYSLLSFLCEGRFPSFTQFNVVTYVDSRGILIKKCVCQDL